ncbi:MAG: DUF421 domain-containing protein [Clostridia bacterium]|nr:DUF421 domain-containing protein [Clostridia bacterium]
MRKTIAMLTLFLRAVFLYLAVFFILRLTGKRQVADLQPFDLLITLLIADLASCAIANTSIPLTYSLVPILALYLVQQGLTWVCLKSAHLRRVICGSPVILIADGVVAEEAMRLTNYTMIDLLDQLRSKDIFDLSNVAYAILETNGTMSVLQKGDFQSPTLKDLSIPPDRAALSYMLVLDGRFCYDAMERLDIDEAWILKKLKAMGIAKETEVFFLHLSPEGRLSAQTKERAGKRTANLDTEKKTYV